MVFWDRRDVLIINFLPWGVTVTSDRHMCNTAEMVSMLSAATVVIPDNDRPYAAQRTKNIRCRVFDHPVYSPDLSYSSHFHLFLHLKKFLYDQHFSSSGEDVQTAVTCWLQSQEADFYDTGLQKLNPQYGKCYNSSGSYLVK